MTVLACFYTKLDPRAEIALKRYAPEAGLEIEWVETPGTGSDYADAMKRYWTGDDDLIIVEQDKEIFPATLPSLKTCQNLWCTCTYWLFPEPHTTLCIGGFGATKFSAEIQRIIHVPDFADEMQLGIDRRFGKIFSSMGFEACLHGMILHHHVYEPRPQKMREHVRELRAQGLLPPAMAPEAPAPHLLPGSYELV
jgi:hypothetical protein